MYKCTYVCVYINKKLYIYSYLYKLHVIFVEYICKIKVFYMKIMICINIIYVFFDI